MICDCCNIHQAEGVAAIPMVPMSVSYCVCCLRANSYPYWVLVGNTASIGELDKCNEAWQLMVKTSLIYQGISLEQFKIDVDAAIAETFGEEVENG